MTAPTPSPTVARSDEMATPHVVRRVGAGFTGMPRRAANDSSRDVSWDVTSQPSTLKATRHAAPATKSWMVPWSNSSMSSCAAENRDSTRNTHHAWTLASTGALRHDHRGGSGSVARQMSSTICFGRTRLRNGTNHAPAPQPGVKRRSRDAQGEEVAVSPARPDGQRHVGGEEAQRRREPSADRDLACPIPGVESTSPRSRGRESRGSRTRRRQRS